MSLPQFYLRKRQRLKLKIYTFHPQVAQGSTVVMLAHVTPHSLSAFLCQDFYTEIFIHPFSVTDIDLSPATAGSSFLNSGMTISISRFFTLYSSIL